MKNFWKVGIGLAAVGVCCAIPWWLSRNIEAQALQKTLRDTRRELRGQGFKIDVSEFNFSTSPEARTRAAALTAVFSKPRSVQPPGIDLMQAEGSNSALVVWKESKLSTQPHPMWFVRTDVSWAELRRSVYGYGPALDGACAALLSGPIQFDASANAYGGLLLPHLSVVTTLSEAFAARAILELHDGYKDAAWTNLMAVTRLATAWHPEPAEASQFVRCECEKTALDAGWQVLQAGEWDDERLAKLQREWESVDFLKGLPEIATLSRCRMVAQCQFYRQTLPGPLRDYLQGALEDPLNTWAALTEYGRNAQYARTGGYQDEIALLLYFRERELELRRAVQCSTWSEMRQLPGITNSVPFQGQRFSPVQAAMSLRQMIFPFQERGAGLAALTAVAESRRRLIIAALALERFHGRHGAYPKSLHELVPEFLNDRPIDFMDGKPLRYFLTDRGRFVLYSTGLDCIDDGGKMDQPKRPTNPFPPYRNPIAFPVGTDLVWPCPASSAEIGATEKEDKEAELKRAEAVRKWSLKTLYERYWELKQRPSHPQ